MSLLQNLPYIEYQNALKFSLEQCELIANLARLKNINFTESKKPGELLLKNLDRRGYTVPEFKNFVVLLNSPKQQFYKPNAKVAILVGNNKYVHLPKLATPSADCDVLSSRLTNMGFTVILLKNTTAKCLKVVYKRIINAVPEDSYLFIYYAGHGCNVNGSNNILGVDCPNSNIQYDHCVTEHFLLNEALQCSPNLCILILDMCRNTLDNIENPQIYEMEPPNLPLVDINIKNLIVCYVTELSEQAYEVLEVDCSESIDSNMSYELRTCDLANVVLEGSQYIKALCKHLAKDADIGTLLDKVHSDLIESAVKKQTPLKHTFGEGSMRSLHDPAIGNIKELMKKLEDAEKDFYHDIKNPL